MSVAAVRRVVSGLESDDSPTDAELVTALAPTGAERERAFAELVGRHGPMVLGVCRGVLADAHAAEDAFQAVFLVLARKADTIRPPGAVGGWLYGVAVRTARKAKAAAARRQRREMATILANPDAASRERERPESSLDRAELRAVIDAELAALPDTHRAAVVLCDLQGKTRAEAAAELNCAEGTVAAWLSRGRKALAARLARRGVALPAAGLAAVVTPELVSAELRSAALGAFAGRGVSDSVLALAEGVMRSLSSATAKLVAGLVAVGAARGRRHRARVARRPGADGDAGRTRAARAQAATGGGRERVRGPQRVHLLGVVRPRRQDVRLGRQRLRDRVGRGHAEEGVRGRGGIRGVRRRRQVAVRAGEGRVPHARRDDRKGTRHEEAGAAESGRHGNHRGVLARRDGTPPSSTATRTTCAATSRAKRRSWRGRRAARTAT